MTALKINPANLPYRGEPTRDIRPAPKIPPHLKVRVLDSPWTKRPHHGREERTQSARINSLQAHRKDLWTAEQEAIVLEMFIAGEPYKKIEKAVGKTRNAIRIHISKMRQRGVEVPRRISDREKEIRWRPDEDEAIVRMREAGASIAEISDVIGRSSSAVKWRLTQLRKRGVMIVDNRKYNNWGRERNHE